MKVYLAGPIANCTDAEAITWREEAKRLRPDIEWIDPMVRDYRGVIPSDEICREIVEGDKADILSCDVVLRNAPRATEGSAQETMFAYEHGKRIVAVADGFYTSPWLLYHAEVFHTLAAACEAL